MKKVVSLKRNSRLVGAFFRFIDEDNLKCTNVDMYIDKNEPGQSISFKIACARSGGSRSLCASRQSVQSSQGTLWVAKNRKLH